MNLAFENALSRVVLDQVSKVVGRNQIVDGNDFVSFFKEPLFDDGTENKAADATEPVDGNIWHDVGGVLPALGVRAERKQKSLG